MLYFEWINQFEKNNCTLIGLENGVVGELYKGLSLTGLRTKPYKISMDEDYMKNVRLTDSLVNSEDAIIASPRLREFLAGTLGKKIETLPVWIKDHKGRIASKEYSFINILDLQDCLALEQSEPDYATINGKSIIISLDALTLDLSKISSDARLFRPKSFTRPILIKEDLMNEIIKNKFEGVYFNPVNII